MYTKAFAMIKWKLETKYVKELKPHPKNPRKLTKTQYQHLKASIDNFGLIDKPIVNLNNQIIGGHQRIQLLKKEKQMTVECWIPDIELSDEQVEQLMIRLNQNTGSFDYDILANQFEVADLIDWGFTPLDFQGYDELEGEKSDPKKKQKECPACGHLF